MKIVNKKKKNAFTLLELVISIAVLGIVLIGLLPVFSYAMSSISRTGRIDIGQNSVRGSVESTISMKKKNSSLPGDSYTNTTTTSITASKSVNYDKIMKLTFGVSKIYEVNGYLIQSNFVNGHEFYTVHTFTSMSSP